MEKRIKELRARLNMAPIRTQLDQYRYELAMEKLAALEMRLAWELTIPDIDIEELEEDTVEFVDETMEWAA